MSAVTLPKVLNVAAKYKSVAIQTCSSNGTVMTILPSFCKVTPYT